MNAMHFFGALILLIGALCISTVVVFITPGIYETVQVGVRAPAYLEDASFARQKNNAIRSYRISLQAAFEDPDFTIEERSHLSDVKIILQAVGLLAIVTISRCIRVFFYRPRLFKKSTATAIVLISGIMCVSILASVSGSFESLFYAFHRLFFTDNRMFPADALLIQLYPELFFLRGFLIILTLTVTILCFSFFCRSFLKISSGKTNLSKNKWFLCIREN